MRTTYDYDANGNVVSKSGESSYEWDPENHLTYATMADGTTVGHTYDADGNRVRTGVVRPGNAAMSCTGNTAKLARADTSTRGNWKGTYGAAGYYVHVAPSSDPVYGSMTVSNSNDYTWVQSTTDVRALQTPAGTDRIASMWWTADTETFHVATSDSNLHTVALYFLDWDTNARAQSVVVKAPDGTVLDAARNYAGFNGGVYAVYTVCGNIDIEVTRTGPYNADVMGVFLSTPTSLPEVATNYLVDTSGGLSQVTAETDGRGALAAYYVRAGDELLEVMRPGGAGGMWTTRFVHADGLGSVRAITDEGGAVVDTRGYEAFGTKNVEAGSDALAYGFAGEPYDGVTKLAYHRARWMDARAGRFFAMDPSANLLHDDRSPTFATYVFSNDSPAGQIDPTGLVSLRDGFFVHKMVGDDYVAEGVAFGHIRFSNYYSISTIVEEDDVSRDKPDLVDTKTREVFEIKTRKGAGVGRRQLRRYLEKMKKWGYRVGSDSFVPGVSGAIPRTGLQVPSGGIASVDNPKDGLILYNIASPQQQPERVLSSDEQSEQDENDRLEYITLVGTGTVVGIDALAVIASRLIMTGISIDTSAGVALSDNAGANLSTGSPY